MGTSKSGSSATADCLPLLVRRDGSLGDGLLLQRRLLLALFALGTNMGIRAIVATGEHGESEAALRHVRRHFITVDNLRAAVTKLVNATFAARDSCEGVRYASAFTLSRHPIRPSSGPSTQRTLGA
ncbi:Tn3 family transposase [Streptomyces sp. NPDC021212]|uniref:Tn3 family transposase n=1 Tax=Streptomyces sp. NPDC021212 TaxID=3365118 RepID=UPI0037ADF9B5